MVDVTSVFASLTIAGPLARECFARFCALDLRPSVTPVGALRPGSIARQPGTLICEAEDRYLILFGWATAEYVWSVVADARRSARRRSGRSRPALGAPRCLTSSASGGCGGRASSLKSSYDVVIIGGGSHGLATAHYLREHGITDVAILEKRYIGSGAAGRNTTILRSNYKTPEGARFYDASVKLYEGLSQDLNFNLLFSQCGHLTLAHSDRAMFVMANRAEVNRLQGIDSPADRSRRGQGAGARDAGRPATDVPDPRRAVSPARRDHPPRRGRLGPGALGRRRRRRDPPEHRGPESEALGQPDHRTSRPTAARSRAGRC